MAWAALTVEDVQTRLSGDELTLLRTKVLASGQTDPTSEIISKVTNAIRGYIAVRYSLGAAGTLPPEIHDAAIAIVRWRMIGRISIGTSGAMSASEQRKAEHDSAWATVKEIPKGEFAIEQPDPADETEHAGSDARYGSDEQLNF